MNPTVIIHPPERGPARWVPYWQGVVFNPNPAQVHHVGGFYIPVTRMVRLGIDRAEIAERVCDSWPVPRFPPPVLCSTCDGDETEKV